MQHRQYEPEQGNGAKAAGRSPSLRKHARAAPAFSNGGCCSDGLTAVWVRERLLGRAGEIDHDHMLFHLAHPFIRGRKLVEVVRALERLIDRHGDGNFADFTLKLTFPRNSNGVYLVFNRLVSYAR
jgi:hypothetical protein